MGAKNPQPLSSTVGGTFVDVQRWVKLTASILNPALDQLNELPLIVPPVAQNKTAQVLMIDGQVVLLDATNGAFNVLLPTIAKGPFGLRLGFKRSFNDNSANLIKVYGSQPIDGQQYFQLSSSPGWINWIQTSQVPGGPQWLLVG